MGISQDLPAPSGGKGMDKMRHAHKEMMRLQKEIGQRINIMCGSGGA